MRSSHLKLRYLDGRLGGQHEADARSNGARTLTVAYACITAPMPRDNQFVADICSKCINE